MTLRPGGELNVEGSVTVDNVVAVMERGLALLSGNDLVIDLAQVTEVDSSAVSMLLEWRRESGRRHRRMRVVNMPENLKSLMQLYGVSEFIHLP